MTMNINSKLPPVKASYQKFTSESIVPTNSQVSRSKSPIRVVSQAIPTSYTPNIEISAELLKTQQMATRGTFLTRINEQDWSLVDKEEIDKLQTHLNIESSIKESSVVQKSVLSEIQSMFNQLAQKQDFDPLFEDLENVIETQKTDQRADAVKATSHELSAEMYELVDVAYDNILSFMKDNAADPALIKTLKGIQNFYNYFIKCRPTRNVALELAAERLDREYQDLQSRYELVKRDNVYKNDQIDQQDKYIQHHKEIEKSLRSKVQQILYEFDNQSKDLATQKITNDRLDENLMTALTKNEDYLTRVKRVQFALSKQRNILEKINNQYDQAMINMRLEQELRETLQVKYNGIEKQFNRSQEQVTVLQQEIMVMQEEIESVKKTKVVVKEVEQVKHDNLDINAKKLTPVFLQGVSTLISISRLHPDDIGKFGISHNGIKSLMQIFQVGASAKSVQMFINGLQASLIGQDIQTLTNKQVQTTLTLRSMIEKDFGHKQDNSDQKEKIRVTQEPIVDLQQEQEALLKLEMVKVDKFIDTYNSTTKQDEENLNKIKQGLIEESIASNQNPLENLKHQSNGQISRTQLQKNTNQSTSDYQIPRKQLTEQFQDQYSQNLDLNQNYDIDKQFPICMKELQQQKCDVQQNQKQQVQVLDISVQIKPEVIEAGTSPNIQVLRNKLFPILFSIPQFLSLQLFFENENFRLLDVIQSEQELNIPLIQNQDIAIPQDIKKQQLQNQQAYIPQNISQSKEIQSEIFDLASAFTQTYDQPLIAKSRLLEENQNRQQSIEELNEKIDDLLDDIFNFQVQNTALQDDLVVATEELQKQLQILNLVKEADTDMQKIKEIMQLQKIDNPVEYIQRINVHLEKRQVLYNIDEQIENTKQLISQKQELKEKVKRQQKQQKQKQQLKKSKAIKLSTRQTVQISSQNAINIDSKEESLDKEENSTHQLKSTKYYASKIMADKIPSKIQVIQQEKRQYGENKLDSHYQSKITKDNSFPDSINKLNFETDNTNTSNEYSTKEQNITKFTGYLQIQNNINNILEDEIIEAVEGDNSEITQNDKALQTLTIRNKAKDIQTFNSQSTIETQTQQIIITDQPSLLVSEQKDGYISNDKICQAYCTIQTIDLGIQKDLSIQEQEIARLLKQSQNSGRSGIVTIKDKLLQGDFTTIQLQKHAAAEIIQQQKLQQIKGKQKQMIQNMRTQNLAGLIGLNFENLQQKTEEEKFDLRNKLFINTNFIQGLHNSDIDKQKQKGFVNKHIENARNTLQKIIQSYNTSQQKSIIDEQLQQRLENIVKLQQESKVISLNGENKNKKQQQIMFMQSNMFAFGQYQVIVPQQSMFSRFITKDFFTLKRNNLIKLQKYGLKFIQIDEVKQISFSPCLLSSKYLKTYFSIHSLNDLPKIISQTLQVCEIECLEDKQPNSLQVQTILPSILEKISYIRLESIGKYTKLPIFFNLIQQFTGKVINIIEISAIKYIQLPIQNVQLKSMNWLLKTIDLIFQERENINPRQIFCQKNEQVFFTEDSVKVGYSVLIAGTYSYEEMVYFPFFLVKWAINRYKMSTLVMQFLFSFVVSLIFHASQNDDLFMVKNFLFYDQFEYEVGDILLVYLRLRSYFGLQFQTQLSEITLETLAGCIEHLYQNWPVQRKTALLDVFCSMADKINKTKIPVISVIRILLQSYSSYRQAQYQMISTRLPMNFASFKQILQAGNVNITDLDIMTFLCNQSEKLFDPQTVIIDANKLQYFFICTEMGRFLSLTNELEKLIIEDKIREDTYMIQSTQKVAEEVAERVLNELVTQQVDKKKMQQQYIQIQEKVSEIHGSIIVFDIANSRFVQRQLVEQIVDLFGEFVDDGLQERVNMNALDLINVELAKKII
ncbi:hypothetical protein SS50377_23161 [Spironucleus salmonicida]|uniref:Uncharacterized protein n=1 Tax=Spironucleus salmonicida TaxID=348837 RepID=V6LLU3_9EUKA|nr:hypothetical protein SS50377_23161 [Spironucleus salmonicida]|eukprot:EST41664.1 Hypothetical protein SS50377_18752 [Spironucleus salmonicida]